MGNRLKFGDPISIAKRDRFIEKEIEKRLIDKVRCPFCKAKADHSFEIDLETGMIGWNFKCGPDCPNSIEWGELHGYDSNQTYTDFRGNPIDEEKDFC